MAFAALFALADLSFCQETRGQIQGRVIDSSGAVVPGVTVEAVSGGTNVVTSSTANSTGDFVLPFLNPGTYSVSASHEGFKRFVRSGILVQVNDRVAFDIKMEIGDAAQSVQVTADAPLLQTSSASAGNVIDNRRIADLPLKDGNAIMLASLAPGVQNLSAAGMGRSRPFDNISISQVSVNGGFQLTNEFTMDGVPNNTGNKIAFVPPGDMVQEFKIQSAPFDASTGYTPAAVINVSTKSGTNQLHGSAYYFNQNRALMANSFFNNRAGLPKNPSYEHRFGVTAGGPVVFPKLYNGHNRTFWQYGYEALRDYNSEGPFADTVPSPQQLTGDFSRLLALGGQYQIYDPATIASAGNGRYSIKPFAGNIIPQSRISPVAQKLSALWTPGNQPGAADGTNNYYDCGCTGNRYFAHMARIDHNFSDRHRLYGRIAYNKNASVFDQRFHDADGAYFDRWNESAAIDDVYTFSPTLLLNVRYGFSRFIETQLPFAIGFDLAGYGFSNTFINQIRSIDANRLGLPGINISGYSGFGADSYYSTRPQTHDVGGVLTQIKGAHEIRYGGGFRVYQQNVFDYGLPSGSLQFGTNWTRGPLDNSPSSPVGQGLASFLLGLPTGGNININASSAAQSRVGSLFVHDDWKVSRKLTLNIGLRYERESALTERFDRSVRGFNAGAASPVEATAITNYAKNPIPELAASAFRVRGGLTFAGVNGEPRTLWNPAGNNFMPRFGFAWAANDRTVIRGGYGIYYDLLGLSRQGLTQSGYSSTTSLAPSLDNGLSFIGTLANPFPNALNQPAGSSQGLATFLGQNIKFYNPNILSPYMQRWEASVQRAFGSAYVLELAYIGSRGTDLRISRNINALPGQYFSTSTTRDQSAVNFQSTQVSNPFYPLLPGTSLAGQTVSRSQLLQPFPQFGSVSVDTNQGYSWYHSMQAHFERRYSNGATYAAAYTWSKMMQAVSYLNAFDALPERVISDQDRTHRLVVSGIYELPFGKGRRHLAQTGKAVNAVLGGWNLSGIFQLQSGAPLSWGNIIFNGDLHNIPLSADTHTAERWINTAAGFNTSSSQQLSANVRTFPSRFSGIRGPAMNNWDLSLLKNFAVTEKARLQLRGEFINAFNHTQFGQSIDTNPASGTFGRLNSVNHLPRVVQLGAKLTF